MLVGLGFIAEGGRRYADVDAIVVKRNPPIRRCSNVCRSHGEDVASAAAMPDAAAKMRCAALA